MPLVPAFIRIGNGVKVHRTGTYTKVVVVGVDMMSSIVDYIDRTTCVIFW